VIKRASWSTRPSDDGVGDYAANATGISLVGTGGSLLVLNPAFDLSLPDYIAPGSLGNYNLQMTLGVVNQFAEEIATPEIVIVCFNDGVMSTMAGVSSTFTGILTKQMVLDTKRQKAISSVTERRLVGGRMLDGHHFHSAKHHMHAGASSGGQNSGGASSGGSKLHSLLR
jgi:hypothetical protein